MNPAQPERQKRHFCNPSKKAKACFKMLRVEQAKMGVLEQNQWDLTTNLSNDKGRSS